MPRSLGQRLRDPLDLRHSKKKELSANTTLDATHSGYDIVIMADAFTITLPATVVGYHYKVVNGMDDGDCLITISPAAADLISGVGLTAADNKDILNTKATAKKGDYVVLIGNGTDGWVVESMVGVWAREA